MTYDANAVATEIKTLFGEPALLSTEKMETYDAILSGLVASLKPWDVMSKLFVRLMVDALTENSRYGRHKTLAIESKYRQRIELQAQRAKLELQKKEQRARAQAEDWSGFSPDFVRMIELLTVMESPIGGLEELFKRAATELDHARALEAAITYCGQLDEMHNSAMKNFHLATVQFQQYRQYCAWQVDEAKTIEGKLEQPASIAAPEASVVPAIEAQGNPEASGGEAKIAIIPQGEGGNG